MFSLFFFFFSSRRRHTRWTGDWSSDVCSSDLSLAGPILPTDWSRTKNGEFLFFQQEDPRTGWDVWALPMSGDRKPVPILTRSEERRVGKECRSRWSA